MKQNKKINMYISTSLILAIVSLIATGFIYSYLPPEIPIHFGVSGQPDNWSDKSFALFTAVLPLAMILLMFVVAKIDPKRSSFSKHAKAYNISIFAMTLFFIGLHWSTMLFSLDYKISIDKFVMLGTGILFIVIGNYMPQVKSNYTFGVKTPWALADENNWRASQRFGGYMFILIGLSAILYLFIPGQLGAVLFTIIVLGAVFACYLYSYLYFRKNGNWK